MNLAADGWMRGGRRIDSANYSARRGDEVRLVVIHGISLPPGVFSGEDVIRLFTNTLDCGAHPEYASLQDLRVAAHFFIRRDGELIQFVSCRDSAWHAGASCWRQSPDCNDYSIGVELEGTDDLPYAEAQYQTLTALLRALIAAYPELRVVGHSDIAPERKTDPGPAFDWGRLFARIGADYDGR